MCGKRSFRLGYCDLMAHSSRTYSLLSGELSHMGQMTDVQQSNTAIPGAESLLEALREI